MDPMKVFEEIGCWVTEAQRFREFFCTLGDLPTRCEPWSVRGRAARLRALRAQWRQ